MRNDLFKLLLQPKTESVHLIVDFLPSFYLKYFRCCFDYTHEDFVLAAYH